MGIQSVVEKFCVQTAVYWGNPTPDGDGGMTYNDPVEVSVRWDDKFYVLETDEGKRIEIDAVVLVTTDLVMEGMMYLGTLESIEESGGTYPDPEDVEGSYEIKGREKVYMPFSTTDSVRQVYLKKGKN